MKYTWIFSLVLVNLSTQINAQISNYFAGNPHWRINSSCSAPYPCVRDDQAEYVVVADTLMDGILWHKMQRQGISSYTYFSSPPIPGDCSGNFDFSEQAGFLRQDSMKIYFRTLFNSTEYLVYDFDLEVGDSLPITTINFQDFLVVNAVDSVLIGSSWRKRIYFNEGTSWLIEGLGHNGGFLESIPPMLECGHKFICFKLDSELVFQGNEGECEIISSIPVIENANWMVSRDLSGNYWNILGAKSSDRLLLMDISGKEIPALIWVNNTWGINLSNYSNGLYTLINRDNLKQFTRIVKCN